MYAIVDVETTGGKYEEEGITEIAIYQYDGNQITDQFISLINPERPIQPFVANLTGINEKMLRNAPKFFEVAKRIVEITTNCVLVAHNASFDYRMLRTEFERLGFDFDRETLCTVELSKKLLPDIESYKLGRLVRSLGIPLSDRHRAAGDARATVELLKLLLNKDGEKDIVRKQIKSISSQKKPKHLLRLIEKTPPKLGIYYLHNQKGDIIYIGKSKNMRKRVSQHFGGKGRKALKIQLETISVSTEETGSELLALLKELDEIRLHKPKHNRMFKNQMVRFGLASGISSEGYRFFRLEHLHDEGIYVTTFKNLSSARKLLFHYAKKFDLCLKYLSMDKKEGPCSHYSEQKCKGACVGHETPDLYNIKAEKFIEHLGFPYHNMVIVDKGRTPEEQSVVLVENNKVSGFGHISLNYQITHIDILRNLIYPLTDNREVRYLIQSYLRKNKVVRIINLS
jgi:DNA polymerase-3 subunit epsilon